MVDVRTSQNHLARDENQQHHLGPNHVVDQAWKQLWLILCVCVCWVMSMKTAPSDAQVRSNTLMDDDSDKMSAVFYECCFLCSVTTHPGKLLVGICQALQANEKLDITRGNDVLNAKLLRKKVGMF